MRIKPVILSGGSGARLWPLSRRSRPKQMLALNDWKTLLQTTVERVSDTRIFSPVTIVTAESHADSIIEQMASVSSPIEHIVLEPSARNTAPAIALAALTAADDDLLLVMPSDHVMTSETPFAAGILPAVPAAVSGQLVTFGVPAERPETGYGYIRAGPEIAAGVYEVDQFVEKPDALTATGFVNEGGYQWNVGIFLFRAATYLSALDHLASEIAIACRLAIDRAQFDRIWIRPDAEAFGRCPAISIDQAILERAENVVVVPLRVSWSDLGSWEALHKTSPKDKLNNLISGNVLALGAQNCVLSSEGPKLVAIGVEDLAIVVVRDSVLVVPLSQSQRVRDAVEQLARSDPQLL